jgi:glycine cleavage system H protein
LFIYTASGFQDHSGDAVYVELPEVGVSVSQGKNFGAVESVKATSDINSPVSGEVVEVNGKLSEEPGLVSAATHTSQNSSEK